VSAVLTLPLVSLPKWMRDRSRRRRRLGARNRRVAVPGGMAIRGEKVLRAFFLLLCEGDPMPAGASAAYSSGTQRGSPLVAFCGVLPHFSLPELAPNSGLRCLKPMAPVSVASCARTVGQPAAPRALMFRATVPGPLRRAYRWWRFRRCSAHFSCLLSEGNPKPAGALAAPPADSS
jgi:hypothetical protein